LWHDTLLEKVKTVIEQENCDFVIWANHLDYSKEQWEQDKPDYIKRTQGIPIPALLINNHSETSHGGAIVFQNGKIISELPFDKIGVLEIKI